MVGGDSRSPREIVEAEGLEQINDRQRLSEVLECIIDSEPKLIEDYRRGKTAAKKSIIGKIMAKTSGLANPVILNEIFAEK